MKHPHSLRPVAMHSVAGLMFSFGLVDYLICHPEAFTPGVFTQCAVGLLTAIGGISAGKAYMQDKTAQPTVAPASDPDHTASPLPNESKPS